MPAPMSTVGEKQGRRSWTTVSANLRAIASRKANGRSWSRTIIPVGQSTRYSYQNSRGRPSKRQEVLELSKIHERKTTHKKDLALKGTRQVSDTELDRN